MSKAADGHLDSFVLYIELYTERVAASQTPSPGSDRLSSLVGLRIHELRTSAGISLAALAASSGLGKGTLSELERGQRNPTLDTLFSVATALSVPLSDVLFGRASETGVVDGPLVSPARGRSVVAQLLDRWSDEKGFTEVYRITIEAKVQQSKPHMEGVVETLTVIGGTAEVGTEAEPVRLTAPEIHTFPGDAPHLYRGIGGVATAVLTMYYPGRPQGGSAW
ncbi:helix-turn-helix domain-containing protein [Kribbella sp. CA-294648]|uniref:helix-turn-helix domain-containing protein n=1 Tax=Kribbella sp. CA-294648 TaxID=3239948 RepID=UPI003D946641